MNIAAVCVAQKCNVAAIVTLTLMFTAGKWLTRSYWLLEKQKNNSTKRR